VQSTKEQLKAQLRRRSRGGGETDRPDVRAPQRKLAFEDIYSFFKDITSGLAHLHANNFIHRDLKPSNCLLHKDGNEFRCLISDFGEVQPENVVRKSTGSTGTISYCAPEVLKQDEFGRYGNFTTKSDIFSLGMILYFMCFGRLPYKSADSFQEEGEDMDMLRAEISSWSGFHDERRERPELPTQLYNFLKRLLAIDPNDRPSANEILEGIRTEKGLQMPPRSRTGSTGLAIGRIQSVDSPVPPGTPVNEREREPIRVRSSAYLEDGPPSDSSSPFPSPNITTPLLMAPPTTPLGSFQNRIALYQHYLISWVRLNQQSLTLLTKLVIFFLKIFSITKPCLPAAARQAIWYPLMLLSALELGIGTKIRWRITAFLLFVHVGVLWMVEWLGIGLCGRELDLRWRF